MTLKECLIQLCDIRLEIKELENKIYKLEPKTHEIISDSVESTTKYFPIVPTRLKIQGLDQKAIKKIEYYKSLLEDRHSKLLNIQIQVEEFIDKLPTSRLRRIFNYRYIEQYPWIKIAALIGKNATEDSIRKEHDRYLEKLEKNQVCPICPENM